MPITSPLPSLSELNQPLPAGATINHVVKPPMFWGMLGALQRIHLPPVLFADSSAINASAPSSHSRSCIRNTAVRGGKNVGCEKIGSIRSASAM
jgi:hypothetical protein